MQDLYEAELSYFAVGVLPGDVATQVADIFELGSIWSPETLVYVFQITIIVCSSVLVLVLINSIPNFKMEKRHHFLAVLGTLAIGGLGVSLFVGASSLTPGGATGETAWSQWREFDQVKAFGWESRKVTVRQRDAV